MLRNNREFCPFPGLLSQDLAAPRACLTSPPFPGGLWKSWQGFILSASWVQSRQSLCQGRLYPKGVVTGRPNGAELSRRLQTRCSPDYTSPAPSPAANPCYLVKNGTRCPEVQNASPASALSLPQVALHLPKGAWSFPTGASTKRGRAGSQLASCTAAAQGTP